MNTTKNGDNSHYEKAHGRFIKIYLQQEYLQLDDNNVYVLCMMMY